MLIIKQKKERYTYDSQGRMAEHTKRNGVHTTYSYTIDNWLRYKKAEPLEVNGTSIAKRRNCKKTPRSYLHLQLQQSGTADRSQWWRCSLSLHLYTKRKYSR